MKSEEISNFCIGKGILIDKGLLTIFNDANDFESVKLIIERIKEQTGQRFITKTFFENEKVAKKFLSSFPQENQTIKKLKIQLGLSIEISNENTRENIEIYELDKEKMKIDDKVKVYPFFSPHNKKIEVDDFTNYFKNRVIEMKKFLQDKNELENLVSISKLSGMRQAASIIGLVYGKNITKNGNIILEVEDITGRLKVLINKNKEDTYSKAEDISLYSVIGFKGFSNKEIFFANDVIFPDASLPIRKKSPIDESVVFISDVHVGSRLFLEKNLLKFIDYLNLETPEFEEAKKIKYLFIVGDLVAGVGVYPNQEKELAIVDLKRQYEKAAELLGKIRKDIKIIIIPGNHDCVRLMEPQPILDEKYAKPLYEMENVIHASNPSLINIGERGDFPGFNILTYHGFSYPYYVNTIPSLMTRGSPLNPEKIMAYLLKNRHLGPTHNTFVQTLPFTDNDLIIKVVPDIFVSGHTHKGGVLYYKNILLLSTTCWEELMPYQEKMGFESDYCKVPMFNLNTGQVKILDFYDEEDSLKKKENKKDVLEI